eukprot:CAMPEP_0184546886 /NCGR_PEP_ID=MMETSP0199_2-20130426/5224_1 /TAXON_ID=1112570 /ORGANISM="Thraustochytrium sp., Strain LLF1b" /LENGTH=118 /DNA_ID=CAMNT_0026941325 /DNA_START=413 /DNA_END=767 /DNA_ORIENTATION=-
MTTAEGVAATVLLLSLGAILHYSLTSYCTPTSNTLRVGLTSSPPPPDAVAFKPRASTARPAVESSSAREESNAEISPPTSTRCLRRATAARVLRCPPVAARCSSPSRATPLAPSGSLW